MKLRSTATAAMLMGVILYCPTPAALAQSADLKPAAPKLLFLLIDNFEPTASDKLAVLDEHGPEMLMTSLVQEFSRDRDVQINFVERRKLSQVLKEATQPDRLPRAFGPRTIGALKAVNADYVIFCTYFKVREDRYRIDARIV